MKVPPDLPPVYDPKSSPNEKTARNNISGKDNNKHFFRTLNLMTMLPELVIFFVLKFMKGMTNSIECVELRPNSSLIFSILPSTEPNIEVNLVASYIRQK